MSSITYELSADSWMDGSTIEVTSLAGTFLASIPLSFVRRGGDFTWRYVSYALSQVLAHQAEGDHIVDASGTTVSAGDEPSSGIFRFIHSGASFYLESAGQVPTQIPRWKRTCLLNWAAIFQPYTTPQSPWKLLDEVGLQKIKRQSSEHHTDRQLCASH